MNNRNLSLTVVLLTILLIVFSACRGAAAIIPVYNNNDVGAGSLRQAISDNAALGGGNTIVFSNVVGTITMLGGQFLISTNVTIVGPGANQLTISGNTNGRLFEIRLGTVVNMSGLTLANGRLASSGLGGCISNSGTLSVTGCTFSNNVSPSAYGNVIYNLSGFVTVRDSIICSNRTFAAGGFIFNDGTAHIINSVLYGNAGSQGGALNNQQSGIMNVTNCTIFANSAPDRGGGIYNAGILTVRSCTIVSNSCNEQSGNGGGGGIANVSPATVNIGNTIVANNTSATNHPDCSGVNFTSVGYNLIGRSNGSTTWGSLGDQVGTIASPINPLLGDLQDNGGNTLTLLPLAGSPARDQGKSFGLTTDQRGSYRPMDFPSFPNATSGDGSDIGALEISPISPLLGIHAVGTNVLLTWSTNATDFRLQATKTYLPSITWTNINVTPVVLGVQYCVTNPASNTNRLYRLVFP